MQMEKTFIDDETESLARDCSVWKASWGLSRMGSGSQAG